MTAKLSSLPGANDPTQSARTESVPEFASVALRSLAAALGYRQFDQSARAFLAEVAGGLGCARVSLGFFEDGAIRVKAASQDVGDFRVELYRDIGDAMEEAIDQRRALQVPETGVGAPAIVLATQRLRSRLGGVVQIVPIRVKGEWIGAICCEWDGKTTITPIAQEPLTHIIDLAGPVLYLLYRDARPGSVQLRETLWRGLKRLGQEEGRWWRRGLLVLLMLVMAGLMVPVQQSVSARAALEGAVERAVVAPIDGFIGSVKVRPGDPVKYGQVVIELATPDLELEARRWEAELSQHESAYMAALARSERGDMMVSLSKAEEARTRLDLARRSLERMQIKAGIDGVVIDGDVTRLQGAPVARGDVLLTLAPANGYRVVLSVDESRIGRIRSGQMGELLLGAMPDRALPIQITRVTPMAQVIDGSNVYRVEATLEGAAPVLRPGLNGVAEIETGREPTLKAAWRWLSDQARMLWWRWGG
ncbi:efflux RND transporter periplasmic adaptor subunit [Nitrogeniibacter aestuarii]|uniref:efflux RND transporter periplasmic adaptor subunit n=1 Tax=Nitrogeniibacter aestuarii TaxID=2815343 RepID=UPI001D0FB067|nr:HlyD family efflux transporter periplasmic adaptor subunit [Nitrogeniibacter aestuarii]